MMMNRQKVEELLEITKKMKVLYVEDNYDARGQMLKMLNNFFNDIEVAVDGLDGLEKYSIKSYDLVITDINMPNMDGLQMSEEILKENPNQYIIIISAYHDTDYLQSSIDLGISSYMHKPVEFEKLLTVLEKSCNQIISQKKIFELNSEIKELLDNTQNGYLSFDRSLLCNPSYSKKCLEIFSIDDINGKHISKLLIKDSSKREFFCNLLENIFETSDKLQRELFISLLPKEIKIADKDISLEYKPIKDKMILILTDITEKKELEKEITKQANIQKMLLSVATNRKYFLELKEEFKEFLNHPSKDTKKIPILLHTFKGNFSQLEMLYIVKAIHKAEDNFKENINRDEIFQYLKESFQKDIELIKENFPKEFLEPSVHLRVNLKDINNIEKKLSLIISEYGLNQDLKDKILSILEDVNRFRYIPLYNNLTIYKNYIQNISKKLQKELKPLEIVGDRDVMVPPYFKPFIKSLTHVFSNAITHGIESDEKRSMLQKDIEGKITCSYQLIKNTLLLEITDDGGGIDVEKITKKAIQNGIITKDIEQSLSYNEKLKLIFEEEFSTSEEKTLFKGRGVGLFYVKNEVEKLGGEIVVETTKDIKTTFRFVIPLKTNCVFSQLKQENIIEVMKNSTSELVQDLKDIEVLNAKAIFSTDTISPLHHVEFKLGYHYNRVIFSIGDDLLYELKGLFFDDSIDDKEFLEMIEALPEELANIILGLSLSDLPNKSGNLIDITTPKTISVDIVEDIIKESEEFFITKVITSKGSLYFTFIKEKDTDNNSLEVKKEEELVC